MAAVKLAKKADLTTLKANLALNAKDYAPGDGTDQTAGLQAFIDDVQSSGRPGYAGEGDFRYTTLTFDVTLPLVLIGAGGRALTKFRPLADAGTGTWALGYAGEPAGTARHHIEGIHFEGPGTYSLGVSTCAMYGLRVPQRMTVKDVTSTGFHRGFSIVNDHHHFSDFEAHTNYYNLYFESSTTGFGNSTFSDGEIDGALFSSVGVSPNQGLVWSTFRSVHFGYSPYSVYLEPGTYTPPGALYSLDGNQFDQCSFEAMGNGLLYDESGDKGMLRCNFNGCGGSFSPTYKIAARDADWTFRVREAVDINIVGGTLPHGAVGLFDVGGAGSAFGLRTVEISGGYDLLARCADSGKRLVQGAQGQVRGLTVTGNGVRARVMRAPAVVSQYQLLSFVSEGQVSEYNGSDLIRAPMGVAYHDAAAGEYVAVAVEGPHDVLTDETIAWPGYSVPVRADERTGKLGKVWLGGTGSVIGALGGASAAGRVPVEFGGLADPVGDNQVATLAGTWAHQGGGFGNVTFYKDASGRVHLKGIATGGAAQLIFTLPVDYRPANQEAFLVHSSDQPNPALVTRAIDVTAAGVVQDAGPLPVPLWISLSGISFRVA